MHHSSYTVLLKLHFSVNDHLELQQLIKCAKVFFAYVFNIDFRIIKKATVKALIIKKLLTSQLTSFYLKLIFSSDCSWNVSFMFLKNKSFGF